MSAIIPLVHRADQGDDMNPMHLDFRVAFDKCFTWCPWGCDGEMRIGSEDRKWSHSWMSNHSQECWLVFLCQLHGGLYWPAIELCPWRWPHWHCYLWLRRQCTRCSDQVCSRRKARKHSYHLRWQKGNKKWPQLVTTTDVSMEIRNDLNRKEHRAKTNMMEWEERNAKSCI